MSRTPAPPPGLSSEALPAWLELGHALRHLSNRGIQTGCQRHPERWWSSIEQEKEAAIRACQSCPVLDACRDYAVTAKEQHGVWAGRDMSDPESREQTA